MIKEACVESFEKSLEAQNNGANRIELCENLAVGIGIGVSSHAVGTSKAMEIGEVEGSMSALSIVFAGILTLVWAPLLKLLV